MDRNEVEAKVKETIAKVLNVDAATVKPESNFVFDLGADSQQSIELVAAFEEAFDIEMDEDAALNVQNVGAAVDFIHAITG
jgi:acyl carrier protein